MDTERLKNRVDGRRAAREIRALVESDNPDFADAFLEEMRLLLKPDAVKQETTDRQRKLSELKFHVLNFGVHAGQCLDDMPRDYLEWLLGVSEETVGIISQYLQLTAETAVEANSLEE